MRRWAIVTTAAMAAMAALLSGCVERTLKITSDPPGARVFLNDEEVGVSPVRVSFLWYGDYDIVLRKAGYETLKTHHRVEPPWHQFPPIDFICECLLPGTIHDDHAAPTFALAPQAPPQPAEVAARAAELRDRATYENE